MITKRIEFNPERDVFMDALLHPNLLTDPVGHISVPERRPALIICPGGGYRVLADREKLPAALPFFADGYQTFILHYSINDVSAYPNPLIDASRVVRWVRTHADTYQIDPDQIGVMGFSAGGHVAAMLGTQWHLEDWQATEREEIERLSAEGITANDALLTVSNRPNAMILSYPVVEFGTFPVDDDSRIDPGSVGKIIADRDPRSDLIGYVDGNTAPAFVWHTTHDDVVPAMQSIGFVTAMQKAGVDVEFHLFSNGPHGMSVANRLTDYGLTQDIVGNTPLWASMAVTWLNTRFGY